MVVIARHHVSTWNGQLGVVVAKEPGTHFNWLVLVNGRLEIFNEYNLEAPRDTSPSGS